MSKIRLLLFEVRKKHYAHPGDRKAVDLTIKKLKQYLQPEVWKSTSIADMGSGYGQTLIDFIDLGFASGIGIDIDSSAIEFAQATYQQKHSQVFFKQADLCHTEIPSCDLYIHFCSFYAFKDQAKYLSNLAHSAKESAILMIFDYSHLNLDKSHGLKDFAGVAFQPIQVKRFNKMLSDAGWELLEEIDLSVEFIQWYQEFLNQLEMMRKSLLQKFTQIEYDTVKNTFQDLLKLLEEKTLGGTLVFARLRSSFFKVPGEEKLSGMKESPVLQIQARL